MCRLFITNKKDFYNYDRAHGILKLMDYLESRCGGHGNGYALIKDGHVIDACKGMNVTNEDIYQRIKARDDWDYVIYHTRIASSGARSDKGCHPFISKDGCNALAMNGTISTLSRFADIMDSVDSELVFRMVLGMSAIETVHILAQLNVIFVGLVDGKPYAVKGCGDLERWKTNTTFHASEFPKGVSSIEVGAGYIWLDNKVVQQAAPKRTRDYFYDYMPTYTGTSLYDDGYDDGYSAGYEDGYTAGLRGEEPLYIPDDDDEKLDKDAWYDYVTRMSDDKYDDM